MEWGNQLNEAENAFVSCLVTYEVEQRSKLQVVHVSFGVSCLLMIGTSTCIRVRWNGASQFSFFIQYLAIIQEMMTKIYVYIYPLVVKCKFYRTYIIYYFRTREKFYTYIIKFNSVAIWKQKIEFLFAKCLCVSLH